MRSLLAPSIEYEFKIETHTSSREKQNIVVQAGGRYTITFRSRLDRYIQHGVFGCVFCFAFRRSTKRTKTIERNKCSSLKIHMRFFF